MSLAVQPVHRVRVRTPGKHIVAFGAAALAMIAVAVLIARGVGASDGGLPTAAASPEKSETGAVALPEFLVDLAPDRSGRVAYVRIAASVRAAPEAQAALQVREAEARERIAFLLRGLSADDLSSEEGLSLLKREMLRRINLVIAPAEADDVAITDIIVQ